MGEDLEAIIFKTFDIPPMPPVAAQVVRAAGDPGTSAADLVEVMSADPGLVAKVLRIANSALFAYSHKVESLQQAVVVLGFKAVRNLAVAASARSLSRRPGAVEDALWRHSVGAAIAATTLAAASGRLVPDEAFTAGILHDIGKFILHQHDAGHYEAAVRLRKDRDMSSVAAEFEVFGFDHAAVGATVLRRWGLPDALVGAVRFHQNVSILQRAKAEVRMLAACVNLADRICYTLKLGTDLPYAETGDTQAAAGRILGLTPEKLLNVVQQTQELYEQELAAFS